MYLSHFTITVTSFWIYIAIYVTHDTLYGYGSLLCLIVTQDLLYMEVMLYVLVCVPLLWLSCHYKSGCITRTETWTFLIVPSNLYVYLQSSAFFQVSSRFSTLSLSISMVMVHHYICYSNIFIVNCVLPWQWPKHPQTILTILLGLPFDEYFAGDCVYWSYTLISYGCPPSLCMEFIHYIYDSHSYHICRSVILDVTGSLCLLSQSSITP